MKKDRLTGIFPDNLKSLKYLILFLLILIYLPPGPAVGAGRKRALIVGINKYAQPGNDLRGCINDTVLISQVLQNAYGFSKDDIVTITDSQATRDNILRAIKEHLVDKSGPDDTAIFYYSGHGYYIGTPDQSGYDEILCPHDMSVKNKIYITHNELDKLLESSRAGHFLVTLDCCHSGSKTKEWGEYEYSKERFFQNPDVPSEPRVEGKAFGEFCDPERKQKGASNWVILAACKSDETAKEDQIDLGGQQYHCGALTRALFMSINKNASSGDFTYEKMFDEVNREVTGRKQKQHPQLEGSYQRMPFLATTAGQVATSAGSGSTPKPTPTTPQPTATTPRPTSTTPQPTATTPKPTPTVTGSTSTSPQSPSPSGRFCGSVTGVNGNDVTVDVGGSRGVTVGSILAVYSKGSGSPDPAVKIGELEVTGSEMLTSKARIIGRTGAIEAGAPVMEISRNYIREKLMVAVDSFPGADEVKSILGGCSFIRLAGKSEYADRVIRPGRNSGVLEICTMDGTVANRFQYSTLGAISGNIQKALNSAYLIKRLYAFTNDNSTMRLELSMGKKYDYRPGDTAELSVSSNQDCYLILLNVGSDGSMTLLYPNQFYKDNLVKKGQTVRIPPPGSTFVYRINPPGGQEMVKAIATKEYIDPWGLDLQNLSGTFKSLEGSPDDLVDNLVLSFNKNLGGTRPSSLDRVAVPTTKDWTTGEILYFIIE